jgi:hypothetical protein
VRATGRLSVIALLLVWAAPDRGSFSFARAEEDCLAAPSGPPSPGSQWHYRTDHIKQRKCWHLVVQGGVGQTGAIVTQPVAVGSTPNPDQSPSQQFGPASTARPALRGSSSQPSIKQSEAGADTTTWPDPASPAFADKVVWPDPPPSAPPSNSISFNAPRPVHADAPAEPHTLVSDENANTEDASESQAAAADVAASEGKISAAPLFIGAVVIIIVGLFARRVVKKTFRQPGKIPAKRQRTMSGHQKHALRKLVRVLEQEVGPVDAQDAVPGCPTLTVRCDCGLSYVPKAFLASTKDRLTGSEGSVLSRALADRADDVCLRLGRCATSAMRRDNIYF